MNFKRVVLVILALLLLNGCSMPPEQITEPETPSTPVPEIVTTEPPVTPVPTPEPTPQPAVTPEPTLQPTPEPTPEPTSAPTPDQPPRIIKQPTDENVSVGDTAYFVARAENATEISWFIAGPDGSTGYSASEISAYLPAISCSGHDTETLAISNITADIDGWKAICRFTNGAGKSYSTAAVIHVAAILPPDALSDFNTTNSIKIITHPHSETAYIGERIFFDSTSENAWPVFYLVSPDGSKEISLRDLFFGNESLNPFPGMQTSMLVDSLVSLKVTKDLDGWFVVAVHENREGLKTASNAARITVLSGTAPTMPEITAEAITGTSLNAEQKKEFLDLLSRISRAYYGGGAGAGMAFWYRIADLADFFTASGISVEDIKLIKEQFVKTLPTEYRSLYRINAQIMTYDIGTGNLYDEEFMIRMINDLDGRLFPWNQRNLTDCFAALMID